DADRAHEQQRRPAARARLEVRDLLLGDAPLLGRLVVAHRAHQEAVAQRERPDATGGEQVGMAAHGDRRASLGGDCVPRGRRGSIDRALLAPGAASTILHPTRLRRTPWLLRPPPVPLPARRALAPAAPSAAYGRLRDEAPCYHDAPTGTYALSRFEDVLRVANDPDAFSSEGTS